MWLNFHREVSPNPLSIFLRFSVGIPWPFLPSLLQFALGSYTQNWIKHEIECCKNRTFYSSFFVPIFRKDVTQWQTETAPIRRNFISAMMSSTFSLPNSKHPTWKACQPFYARHVLEQVGINLKGLNVDKLKAKYQELMKQIIYQSICFFWKMHFHTWLTIHSCPNLHFHITFLCEPKVMLSGISGKFFSDHSATNSRCTVTKLLLISKPPFPLWLEYMRFWLLLIVYECR